MQVERTDVLEILRQSHFFLGLSGEQLENVADRAQIYLYDENAVIFLQGGQADGFYFILRGEVKISRRRREKEDVMRLGDRDYFGEESLLSQSLKRYATATALTEVILICLKPEDIQELQKKFPSINAPMRMAVDSYLLAMSTNMDWRLPDEVIHYITHRHWVFLGLKLLLVFLISGIFISLFAYLYLIASPGTVLPLILFILSLVALLAGVAWMCIDWANDFTVVTDRRVIKLEKVMLIYDSRQEVPLDAILADDLRTDQLGRMLGYGTILVRTFTGVMELNRLGHPQLVINLINEIRDRKKFRRHNEQLHLIDQTILERVEHRPVQKKPPVSPEGVPVHVRAGPVQDYLSRLFALRIQEGNIITYRTHWIILLKKITVPSLLLLLLLIVVLLIWLNLIPLGSATGTWLAIIFGPLLGLWWLYRYVDWRNDRYIITPEMISDVYRKPLGTEERKSAPIRNILSIDYERKDIIGLIFNFGTVSIRVGDTTLTFNNVVNPAEVQRELFQYFMDFKKREEARLEQERHDQMADWFERYHGYVKKESPEEPDY